MGIFVGGGITIGGGISFTSDGVVANVSNVIGYYTITLGTKTPVLGNTGQSPFPANGWTSIISASGDDANTVVSLPFTWKYNNTDYNKLVNLVVDDVLQIVQASKPSKTQLTMAIKLYFGLESPPERAQDEHTDKDL